VHDAQQSLLPWRELSFAMGAVQAITLLALPSEIW